MHTAAFKYLSLAQKLKRQIAVAGLQPGDRLPTEDELAHEHGLSRITIRRALALLEEDGLVSRKRKLGTFVIRALEHPTDLHLLRGVIVALICNGSDAPGEEDHALSSVLRGLERSLSDHGFTVQIMSLGRNEAHDRARLERVLGRGDVEGVCAVGPCAEKYRDAMGPIPMVHSCTFVPEALPWVGMSAADATHACVGHMLDRGHRRVAAICGPWVDSRAMADFAAGYRRAHEERGLPFHRHLLNQAYAGESLVDLAREVLTGPARPTAVFGEDWRVCRAILTAAESAGLKLPDGLSLVGLGQNTQYLASSVGITAYVPANERVGEEIGRVLTRIVDGHGAPPAPVYVPGRLIERDSVAPPRAP